MIKIICDEKVEDVIEKHIKHDIEHPNVINPDVELLQIIDSQNHIYTVSYSRDRLIVSRKNKPIEIYKTNDHLKTLSKIIKEYNV